MGSEQVLHKPGCATTVDDEMLEISDLGSIEIVLYIYRKQRRLARMQNTIFSPDAAYVVLIPIAQNYWE